MEVTAPGYVADVRTVVVPPYSCTVITQRPLVELEPVADG
jgi:hypothetical protein